MKHIARKTRSGSSIPDRIPVPHSSWSIGRLHAAPSLEIVRPEDFWSRLGL